MKIARNDYGPLSAILNGCIQFLRVVYKPRNLKINLQNYPIFKQLSELVLYISIILSFCYSYQMHNVSQKLSGKILTLFERSFLLFNSLNIFRGRHGDLWLKNDVLYIMFFFWKVAMWNLTSLEPGRYVSLPKRKSATTKMGLKNRLNILLHIIWGCYTHFLGD